MTDLQMLFTEIEQLEPEELQQIHDFVQERYVQMHQIKRAIGNPNERITKLRAALENFREGISDEEMRKIAEDMYEE